MKRVLNFTIGIVGTILLVIPVLAATACLVLAIFWGVISVIADSDRASTAAFHLELGFGLLTLVVTFFASLWTNGIAWLIDQMDERWELYE